MSKTCGNCGNHGEHFKERPELGECTLPGCLRAFSDDNKADGCSWTPVEQPEKQEPERLLVEVRWEESHIKLVGGAKKQRWFLMVGNQNIADITFNKDGLYESRTYSGDLDRTYFKDLDQAKAAVEEAFNTKKAARE